MIKTWNVNVWGSGFCITRLYLVHAYLSWELLVLTQIFILIIVIHNTHYVIYIMKLILLADITKLCTSRAFSSLSLRSQILLEKLIVDELLKKYPSIYGNEHLFNKVRHKTCPDLLQNIFDHKISLLNLVTLGKPINSNERSPLTGFPFLLVPRLLLCHNMWAPCSLVS
jgi:hypothetical protein